MAGLGEVCSHIAATLFAVDAYNRLSKDDACTSQLCAWLPPSMQNVEYAYENCVVTRCVIQAMCLTDSTFS